MRHLIRISVHEYVQKWYERAPSHNAWVDDSRFIVEIEERPKRAFILYVIYLSDKTSITVDGNRQVEVECY